MSSLKVKVSVMKSIIIYLLKKAKTLTFLNEF